MDSQAGDLVGANPVEKLVLGYSQTEAFYQDSLPSSGFGWLDVSANEGGGGARARFWADRLQIQALASAIREKLAHPALPVEVEWNDEQEGRAFRVGFDQVGKEDCLIVRVEVGRIDGDPLGEPFQCSFQTTATYVTRFNAAIADLVTQRCVRAALKGW